MVREVWMAPNPTKQKRSVRFAVGILVCCVFGPPASMAQDAEWGQLLAQGQQLQAQGRYAEAASSFQSALDRASASSHPLETAQSLYQLGLVKQVLGEYSSAGALYEKANALCEQHPAPRLMGAILLNNARLYGVEGKFEEAALLAGKSLEIHQAQLGPNHPSVADTLDAVGWIQLRLGHYQQAESAYVQSLAIREKGKTPDQLGVAATLNDLGFLQYSLGHYQEAEVSYRRALALRSAALGSNHPDLADSMLRLGELSSIGIVLDISGSTRDTLAQEKAALRAFLQFSNPEDDFFLAAVSSTPRLLADRVSDPGEIENLLPGERAGGDTALCDTIYFALHQARLRHYSRRALLVISDGMDNHSRYTKQEVMREAMESDTQIY